MTRSSVLGYPRIGADREWKKALEAFWAGKLEESEFHQQLQEIRLNHLRKQQEKGIDLIAVNDFSYYDHVLDTATMFGIIPKRFPYKGGEVPLSVYYGIARGTKDATASEMTKWFNTNYHYIVPELDGATPVLTENRPLAAYKEAKEKLGIEGKPVIVGPLTFLKLSKGYQPSETDAWLKKLLPLYVQILQELAQEGVQWVQIDEPILVTKLSDGDLQRLRTIYETFAASAPGLNIMLQTYFEAVENYQDIIQLPVSGIGLDFVHGQTGNVQAIKESGFPSNKVLGAGVIDGRGIWKASLREKLTQLEELTQYVAAERLIVQSSCSLLHVPVTVNNETKLLPELKGALAFADEKLNELVLLTKAVSTGAARIAEELEQSELAIQALKQSGERNRHDVQQAVAAVSAQEPARSLPFAERHVAQQNKWQLPIFPTTTIGSFPQSAEVRKARQLWRKGEWNNEQYEGFIQEQIDIWIKLQEEIGLDVLVHGEFERTDMVEFFGEKLEGFAFTQYGWVQSYGSRCVKPPVIFGDVAFEKAMTVEETKYAQSKTNRPVKGMLTGPITIMNWSFVREDITREQIAYQLAYALRQEVEALEQAGIGMIQVDEPAVREGLPLKEEDQAEYLAWAVKAFRMTTCTVQPTTQIHTHMCYCEFHDMIDSIESMDADVISIETSRSHGELIHSFEVNTYKLGIGLGVYDIHSPRVPRVEEMTSMIDRALRVLDPKLFWINPDCGLKTRGKEETVESLRNMVQATEIARSAYSLNV
ncbi:5-methyltetrahydropteroyltriglutamate--homocysteine S-methyltransferase [Paenibacillus glucanolyticus]|jgi:5-methyltetrahydropteroyltriglutamate--homocysteine methyltransferase|uniref:5-methyltetrahydropteroyltriglutamate-- homocysteine S-methyltransferase n=1 Tax=Paenibacillus TaxID=44249 RepID=UPI0003E246DF|nr:MULTISPECIES: 5-methyltetrahydropteroyltriglutamate--homocysteine S-methyltransferase [Paenibacillus]ANA82424.1 5-methyltetrahydropteroyltriglutamate--homocysteine S-methyltransferase [Paenibacillus glucanolyticus]AVV58837.1 5-methyltetrahydropteroyltriglutamate--homocysteine S-methyltransferase [Paenibacillus glucanolyticus]ETT33873.1 5-methyltetrahydropteroyltriglutamate--homocysteine S-methyltransferase [Paenibacillus sp. FSL R5-808]OMF80187.1 5-methyltetrahydropteroyltriglutamate--homocy